MKASQFLSFKKGDLLILEDDEGADIMHSGWCYGLCQRTNQKGDFPSECVYVLPTINLPPPEILVRGPPRGFEINYYIP